jgi:hypothetical protein
MPPEYLNIFLEDVDVPEADAFLGEEDTPEEQADQPTVEELREDPDVRAVLEAAADLPTFSPTH